jgi:hypothetical protein
MKMDIDKEAIPSGPPTRWLVAVHEAAHAVCAHEHGIEVSSVTVEGIVTLENERDPGEYLGCCYYDPWDARIWTDLFRCVLDLVGHAATHKGGYPENLLVPRGKFLELVPYEGFLQVADEHGPGSDAGCVLARVRSAEDPKALYEEARKKAEAFVEEHWTEIITLAEMLMEKDTTSSPEVQKVLGSSTYRQIFFAAAEAARARFDAEEARRKRDVAEVEDWKSPGGWLYELMDLDEDDDRWPED